MQKIKYGIVGFSRNQFDKKKAYQILDTLFKNIKAKHPNKEIEIVSGYTNSGVPKIAYELADKYKFTTVGFSAQQALKVKSGIYPVQKVIIKGLKFGDESQDFVRYIDGLIRVGGGTQSRTETELFKTLHTGRNLNALLKEFEVEWYGSKPKTPFNIINGLVLIDNFISPIEEAKLIVNINKETWSNELSRRVQHYGYKYNYKSRNINASMKVAALPEWTNPIINKILQAKLMTVRPDQMIINEYNPGQGIANHIDCEPCFEDEIVSVSLGSSAIMDFINPKTKTKHPIVLKPRSAILLSKDARYNWTHGIPARKSDLINNQRVKRTKRISLTFRKVNLTK